jgi:hypothetical protein
MSDPVHELRQELRGSLSPVSSFFLVDSEAALVRLSEKLACLSDYGVTAEQARAMVGLVARLRSRYRPEDEFEERLDLEFLVGSEHRFGLFQVRGAPGHGLEVELILPGVVASSAPGFLTDGFFCGFMPPSFYD